MTNKNVKREDGFTIIEVLIVLAIAGLIMLIVFLAVPALQRNARNTSRKSDASSLASALSEYINNNDGQLPASCTGTACNSTFLNNWKPGFYTAPNVTYTDNTTSGASMGDPKNLDNISIGSYLTCGSGATAGQATSSGASSRSVAIVYDVETGSGGTGMEQCITAN
jgi:prepilin-type N-terminal cleavage/methylation domain-containing protein